MIIVTLRKLGGSVVMGVPVQILSMLHIGVGTQVSVNVVDGKLVVKPRANPHFTLPELLAQCSEESMSLTAEDSEWLDARTVGQESL
jgi:antitoxin ChpS